MEAIVYHKYGSPDVLNLEEVQKPTPRDNEVLIKVHAASVNSWDWDLLRGSPFLAPPNGRGAPKPESTEGPPWGQPLKKLEGAPLHLG